MFCLTDIRWKWIFIAGLDRLLLLYLFKIIFEVLKLKYFAAKLEIPSDYSARCTEHRTRCTEHRTVLSTSKINAHFGLPVQIWY